MAEWPDEDQQPGMGGGEPISQDALDALLAASNTGDMDDSGAFDSFGGAEESDLNFGMDEEETEPAIDAMGGLGEDIFASAAASAPEMPGLSMGAGAVDFSAFQMGGGADDYSTSTENDDFLRVRDIPLDVTVELGRTKMLIKDILELSTGSIIELDKIAGEPVDLFANGLLVARGEVIVIDDNFGVRVTEIITAEDRIKAQYAQSLAA